MEESSITFHDFLERMRNPASVDLVRSIKSFIVSFSFSTVNPDNDGKRVQEFFTTMEAAFSNHPLWESASDQEFDSAAEALEKYVMNKLFARTFASSPEDTKLDLEISHKINLLQTFFQPHHLEIPTILLNQPSLLLAEKELHKINAFKSPGEKLQCIMNCCKVINNVLLSASMSDNNLLAGADTFLPLLIYVTIKANPPQLHSNLRFIQLYRRQAKLVSEAAYYFTNVVSAKSFIADLSSKSLSMRENEYEERMEAARKTSESRTEECVSTQAMLEEVYHPGRKERLFDSNTVNYYGASGLNYPYMGVEAGDLTVKDVEILLRTYKDVVAKYTSLRKAVKCAPFIDHFQLKGKPNPTIIDPSTSGTSSQTG